MTARVLLHPDGLVQWRPTPRGPVPYVEDIEAPTRLRIREAFSVAAEHCRWCETQGMSPGQVAASVGAHANTWESAERVIAAAWLEVTR